MRKVNDVTDKVSVTVVTDSPRVVVRGQGATVLTQTLRYHWKDLDGGDFVVRRPVPIDLILELVFDAAIGRWVAKQNPTTEAHVVQLPDGRFAIDTQATSGFPLVEVVGGRAAIERGL